jgi:hypothetical protein
MSIIKAENKMSLIGTQASQGMTMSLGEESHVTWSEIILCGLAIWRDCRYAHIPLYDVGPSAGDRVPMQFTEPPGFNCMETPAILVATGSCLTVDSFAIK